MLPISPCKKCWHETHYGKCSGLRALGHRRRKASRKMGKHTPGPWHAVFSEMGGYDCMTDAIRITGNGRYLADLDLADYGQEHCSSGFKSEEAEANARLIAVAPEMFSVLKDLLPKLAAHGMRIDEVKAVISKAE